MPDTILINPPVSSPLHPQLNLPLLKGYLKEYGYDAKVIDSNVRFFSYFLGEDVSIKLEECLKNPISILGFYSDLENKLWQKSKAYDGLHVGLRSLSMKYDRIYFNTVIDALEDRPANPFIDYYESELLDEISNNRPKIVGIGVTFQDQIIPAFTFSNLLRKHFPDIKIVMGGQIITRCHTSMALFEQLNQFYDYLVLWDGESGFLDVHREVLKKEQIGNINIIPSGSREYSVDRKLNAPSSRDIPSPDFSDIDFNDYYYPDILVPIQTTRGCYANCAFCAIPFGSNSYRIRSVDRIIGEMIRIQHEIEKKNGKKAIYFKFMEDTSSPILLKKLSVEIERRGLDFKWETFARLEKAFAEPDMMAQLFRGGCRKIHWGLESNDPDILKRMNKKISQSHTDEVLKLSGEAGILNFCFVLIGFPGETDEMRQNMVRYIVGNKHIHTLTLATFDLTRGAPMEQNFESDNIHNLDMTPAEDFQVRLPYTVKGDNWKKEIVPKAHRMMIDIIKERPDIGFITLFPDQIRSLFCEEFGNEWGRVFVERYGRDGIREMLLNSEKYLKDYENNAIIAPEKLPEPLQREHYRTKEDLALIARAMQTRRAYETRRFDQV
jgi:hypothetical protein